MRAWVPLGKRSVHIVSVRRRPVVEPGKGHHGSGIGGRQGGLPRARHGDHLAGLEPCLRADPRGVVAVVVVVVAVDVVVDVQSGWTVQLGVGGPQCGESRREDAVRGEVVAEITAGVCGQHCLLGTLHELLLLLLLLLLFLLLLLLLSLQSWLVQVVLLVQFMSML